MKTKFTPEEYVLGRFFFVAPFVSGIWNNVWFDIIWICGYFLKITMQFNQVPLLYLSFNDVKYLQDHAQAGEISYPGLVSLDSHKVEICRLRRRVLGSWVYWIPIEPAGDVMKQDVVWATSDQGDCPFYKHDALGLWHRIGSQDADESLDHIEVAEMGLVRVTYR